MTAAKPNVLIADDDPISLRFLDGACVELGCATVATHSGTSALRAAADNRFDLMLLDCRMPDFGGAQLLDQLRRRGATAPAVATSAGIDAQAAARLRSQGFADTLAKPASLAQLREILQRLVGASSVIMLDDRAAATALGGNIEAVRALRGLLAQELAELRDDDSLTVDPQRLRERLHRLRASCGFCGATALAAAAAQLELALRSDPQDAKERLSSFLSTCESTAAALRG